jgi:hypothetical protein
MVASDSQVEYSCRKEDDEQTFCEMRMDGPTWLGLMGHVSAEQVYKYTSLDNTIVQQMTSLILLVQKKGGQNKR